MHREIEIKYDVPLSADEEKLIVRLGELLAIEGFNRVQGKKVNRVYTYFDTPQRYLSQKGETIRRVEGFKNGHEQGRYRYDYKKGTLADRYEENVFHDAWLSPQQILKVLRLDRVYPHIEEVATADTVHYKATFSNGQITLEAKVDYFCVRNGSQFKELEVELAAEDGTPYRSLLEDLGRRVIEHRLGLRRIDIQKYTRVLTAMGKQTRGKRKR